MIVGDGQYCNEVDDTISQETLPLNRVYQRPGYGRQFTEPL